MFMVLNFIFILILFMIVKNNKYILMVLMSFEFMVFFMLLVLMIMEVYMFSNSWILICYLIFAIMDSIIGIMLMISMVNYLGNQNISMMNLVK